LVLEELHEDALRPNGFLQVGWNTGLHAKPEALGLSSPFLVTNREAAWTERLRFWPETHVYNFYRRRSD
jgi:hypothetical protein